MNRNQTVRLLRFVIFGATLGMVLYGFFRYSTWSIKGVNDSMAPAYPPQTNLLIDKHPREPLVGDVFIYLIEGAGKLGRVAALGGDRLEVREGILYVEGRRTIHRVPQGARPPGRVPPGQLWLVNDNPRSRYPDSFTHGPVAPERLHARVLTKLDFL